MRKGIKAIGESLKLMWELDRIVLIVIIVMAIIEAVTPYIGILLSAYILDGLATGSDIRDLLLVTGFSVGGVFLLTAVNAYLKQIKEVHIDLCGRGFDRKKWERTLTMDFELLDSPFVNELCARIDSDNIWGAGFYSIIYGLSQVTCILAGLGIAVIILIPLFFDGTLFHHPLSLGLLLLFVLILIGSGLFSGKNNRKFNAQLASYQKLRNVFTHFLHQNLDYRTGKDVRIYDVKPLIQHEIERDKADREFVVKSTKNSSAGGFASGLSSGLLMTLSYVFVVLRAVSGAFGIGSVAKYASVIYQFTSQLNSAVVVLSEFTLAAHKQKSSMDYMNVPDVLYKGTLPVEKRDDNEYELAFHNVSFKYPGSDEYVLQNVSLSFRIGQRLAVVGMNGSGKTTMIKLLCRLYDPTEGVITLNGIDIKKYRYEEYMRIFSVVFQDFKLFSFSLGQNIAASMDVDKAKAEDCLRQAGFGDRLSTMPQGLDTPLYKDYEPDGIEISGGEAQKIALARALYKDAPFIILDEPTAALDPVAEYEIYSKFNEIVGDKTAIYISHRLSSCRFCDEIVVFDHGAVIQQGSHDALVADEGGKYHELWYAQAQYYV